MDAQLVTRAEFVELAQQLALLAVCAGAIGGLLWSFGASGIGALIDWAFDAAQRRARINAARARGASPDVRGMGLGPMSDSSRPAYPHQGAGGELGRVSQASRGVSQSHGAEGRVVKRSEDPRPLTVEQASPDPCLKDRRAEGVPVLRCGHGGGDYSGEVPSTSEELTLAPLGPLPAMRGA